LKYSILRLKNKPEYFKPDGYKYYFYDTLGNVFKSLISEPIPLGIINNSGVTGYAINDNQIQLFNGAYGNGTIITIKEGYFDINTNELGVKYLGKIKRFFDEVSAKEREFNDENEFSSQMANTITFEKMLGFVRILEQ
jgi:hypothetical protein